MRIIEDFISLVAEYGWAAVGPVPGPPGMEEYQFRGTRPDRADFRTLTGTRVPFVAVNQLLAAMGYLPAEPDGQRGDADDLVQFVPETNSRGQPVITLRVHRFIDKDWVRMAELLAAVGRL